MSNKQASTHAINGLVLCGGRSRRMGQDKATLVYRNGQNQARRTADVIEPFVKRTFFSVRNDQDFSAFAETCEVVVDTVENGGPIAGILAAMELEPTAAWLVVACDLPLLNQATIRQLLDSRSGNPAVAFASAHDGKPEPLCALYEPSARALLVEAFSHNHRCPRHLLTDWKVPLLRLAFPEALANANDPAEYESLRRLLANENHDDPVLR